MTEQLDQIKAFFENAAASMQKAATLQANFANEAVMRAARVNAEMADDLQNYFKGLADTESYVDALENNVALRDTIGTRLEDLASKNQADLDAMQDELKSLFTPAEAAAAPAPAAKTAPAAKKATAKKAA